MNILLKVLFFRYENTFILTGVELPSPSADRDERQTQLKKLVTDLLLKLDPALSVYKLNYVRVIKGPKPSILEVECENAARYNYCKIFLQNSFNLISLNTIHSAVFRERPKERYLILLFKKRQGF